MMLQMSVKSTYVLRTNWKRGGYIPIYISRFDENLIA